MGVLGVVGVGVALLLLLVVAVIPLLLGLEVFVLVVRFFVLEVAVALVVVLAAKLNKKDRACDHRTMGSSAQWLMSVSNARRDRGMSSRWVNRGEGEGEGLGVR